MKRFLPSSDTLLIVAIVMLASVCAQAQQNAIAQDKEEGKVVVLDPEAAAEDEMAESNVRIAADPSYWIGVRGRSIESAVLRTHLQLAEDMGVVVEEVLDGSPADKAGLRKHDIILRCNGDAVDNMQVLQKQVASGKDKPLELKIIRLGKQEALSVVPEERPDDLQVSAGPAGRLNGDLNLQGDVMKQLMNQFGARNIGPGVVFRGGGQMLDLNQMPNGVSVAIERRGDGPAQITVKQGDKTWQIEGDDAKSLEQLPEDVRPFVEQILRGQNGAQDLGGGFDFGDLEVELQGLVPRQLGGFERPQFDEDATKQRIDRLERKLQDLMKRFEDHPGDRRN